MVQEGKTLAVYTLVDFKKGKLQLFPNTGEVKDRYWTLGRSCLVRTESIKRKHLALDGRLANKVPQGPVEETPRPFSLFWVIPRTLERAECNVALEYATCSCDIKVAVGVGSKRKFEDSGSIEIPYLCNPKDIPAGTKLVALDDVSLRKVHKALKQE